jgi:alanine-synthesizing transaminase
MFSNRTNWKLSRNRLTEALEEVKASGARVLDLTLSNPTRAGLRYDESQILHALSSPNSLDYDPQPKGLPSARAAVTDYYQAQHKVSLNPENVILTTSTSEGYSFVSRLLCNPGDELLVPKPSYPLFEFLADLQDVKLIPYPLIYDHGWQMDFPGSFVHSHERDILNRFCRQHNLAVIADEVFLDYAHDRSPQQSFAANQNVLTFTLSGVSKISALPQMKVAWIVSSGPQAELEAAQARLEVIADTYLSMNAPIQWATLALLEQRKDVQRQLLNRVRENLTELDRQLALQKSCERLNVEGGWYAVLRVPATQTDEELAIDLLRRKNVLVHPGHFYDFPGEGHLVLSLITPADEFAMAATRVLEIAGHDSHR